jgi:hypothetical protein
MSSPSMSPDMSPDPKSRLSKVLGLAALSDLAVGVVLVFLGLDLDSEALTIAGIALAGAGLVVATWAAIQRGKPTQL